MHVRGPAMKVATLPNAEGMSAAVAGSEAKRSGLRSFGKD